MEIFKIFGSFVINREEAIRAIDDVEQRSDKAADQMQKNFEDIGKASEESSKRISKGFDEAVNASDKSSKAVNTLGSTLKDTGEEAARTGTKIDDLGKKQDKAAESTRKADGVWADFNRKLRDFGGPVIGGVLDGLSKFGALLTNPIGAGIALVGSIAAIGTQGLKTAVQLDDLALQYRATTGANIEETERFRHAVEMLYRSNTDSYEAIAEAVTAVRQRLGDLGDDMAAVTQRYMDFASVNRTDVKSAVSMVADTLDAFNMPLERSGELMDKLTRASQATGRPVDSLVGVLQKSASAIQGLNLDLDDAIGLLTMFESVGISAERVNNGFANSLQRLERPTDSQAAALRRLGVTLDENNRVVDSYDVALKRMIKTIKEADHEADVFEDARAIFGVNAGQQWVRGIRAAGDSLDEFMRLIQEAEGTVQQAADTMNESLGARWTAIKRNYIEPFVEYLGSGFLAILEYIIGFIEEWAPRVTEFFSWIGDSISAVWSRLVADTGGIWGSVRQTIQSAVQEIQKIIEVVLGWIQNAWATHGETIYKIVRLLFENIITVIQAAVKILGGVIDVFVGLFTSNWARMGEGIQKIWHGIWDAVIAILTHYIEQILLLWNILWDTLTAIWDRWIRNFDVNSFLNLIKDIFGRAINWMINDLPKYLSDVAKRIINAFRNALARNAERVPIVGQVMADKIGTATTTEPQIDYNQLLREATSSTIGSTGPKTPSTSWLDVGPAPSVSISAPKVEVELPDTDLSDLDWSGFSFDDFGFGGFDFGSPFGGLDLPRGSRGSSTPKSTTIQLDEKTSETFFEKLDELITRIVDAIREVTSRFVFEVRGIVGNIEDLLTQSVIPVAIEDVDPNVSGNDVVPDGGYRVANILLQLDGRIIARAIGQPLVDEIVIRGGI